MSGMILREALQGSVCKLTKSVGGQLVVVVLALVSAARVPALPCWMKGDVVWAGGRGGLGWFVAHYYPPALVPALKTPVGLSTRANLPR